MSRKNTITIEFTAIGDGLDRIEKALGGIDLVNKKLAGATGLSTLTSQLKLAERGAAQVAAGMGLLPSGASASVGAFAGLTQALSGVGAAGGLVGIALAAAALEIAIIGAAALKGAEAFVHFAETAIDKSEEVKRATLGLQSVAAFKGIDPAQAVTALRSLDIVKNGLISLGDASTALKNLLQTGFDLKQSIDVIKAFGDSAAFGRQQSLSFGYAIVSATEGVRNGNSILSDNAGVTKNLSLILKEAGFTMQDLADKTKGTAARQALYNGLLHETVAQQGDAAKLTELYSGKVARLDAGYTILLASIGDLFTRNSALLTVLDGLAAVVDDVNANFDKYIDDLKALLVLLELAALFVQNLVAGFAGLASIALYVTGILGALVETIGLVFHSDTAVKEGQRIEALAADLQKLASAAAQAAQNLPLTVAALRGGESQNFVKAGPLKGATALGENLTGRGRGGIFEIPAAISDVSKLFPTSVQQAQDKVKAFWAETLKLAEQRAEAVALADERHLQAWQKQIALERESAQLGERTAQAGADLGANPVQADLNQALLKLSQEAQDRLESEGKRLLEQHAGLLKKLVKEKDPAAKAALRTALTDLDAAAAAFQLTNQKFTNAQKDAARIDFVSKFADQLQSANTKMFDITAQILDNNPFVTIFRDASRAVFDFNKEQGKGAAELQGFAAKVDDLLQKRLQAARAASAIQGLDLKVRQIQFGNKVDIGQFQTPEDINKLFFQTFTKLKFGGEESARRANEFLTQAVESGKIDINLLTPGQAKQVFRAYTDLQKQLVDQEEQARQNAQNEADAREAIEKARIAQTQALIDGLKANTDANTALDKTVKEKKLLGEILIDVADGVTADPVVPAGLGSQ